MNAGQLFQMEVGHLFEMEDRQLFEMETGHRALCSIKFLPVATLGKNLMIHICNFGRPLFCYGILFYFLYALTQQQYYNNVLFNDIFQLLQPCLIKKQVTLCRSVNNKIT